MYNRAVVNVKSQCEVAFNTNEDFFFKRARHVSHPEENSPEVKGKEKEKESTCFVQLMSQIDDLIQ